MLEEEVKNLGVTFDLENTFDNHIGKACHACYYHIRDLRCIPKFLIVDIAILVAKAIVSSRLDQCNSLLYGVSMGSVAKPLESSKCTLFYCFQIGQNESCHTLSRKIPLAFYFILYPFQIQATHF